MDARQNSKGKYILYMYMVLVPVDMYMITRI